MDTPAKSVVTVAIVGIEIVALNKVAALQNIRSDVALYGSWLLIVGLLLVGYRSLVFIWKEIK